jgi:phage shock protein PspC (stress-responsive transcriptional regulator)
MDSRATPRRICTVLAALETRGWGCMIMLYVIRRVQLERMESERQ